MKNTIEFAKKAREAYINYISTKSFNIEICNKISNYINNIQNLTIEEEQELIEFINTNTINIEHVADIYIPEDNKRSVKSKFKRIIPMKLSKPSGKIYKAKGDFKNLIKQNNIVKIRRLKKFKPKKIIINQ